MLKNPELVQSVLADYRNSPLSAAEKALFAFVAKVNGSSNQIRREDVDEAKRAGWSDEALYDAITVAALFNFFNRWVDASGVHEMSAEAHEASGKRLAQFGYVPPST
ncbi:MAG TPA: peroxidase [Terriglobia bacterium]|nr:peroxidase [Terriglobia bacterium]